MVLFTQARSRPRGRFLSDRAWSVPVNGAVQLAIVGLAVAFVALTVRELTHHG
jgi:hypothetical protein